jgi:hypothetical protein
MNKDLFIDNNIASKFSNPMDSEYRKLIKWLLHNNIAKPEDNAYLVVSKKLLVEYYRSAQNAASDTAIPVIIGRLQADCRLTTISNEQIKQFKAAHFTKKVERSLNCNHEDREHLPVVLLSARQYALSYDDSFINDLVNFPGFRVTAAKRPELIPYRG